MKLNKLFLLTLALPLAFVACEKKVETASNPVLTLTSKDTMTYDAEGGEGEITYSLVNAVEGVKLTATCDAEWIVDLTAGDKVTFTVAANEDDNRETKIVVAYGDQKFEVKIRQNCKDNTMNDSDASPFAYAYRLSSAETMNWPNNYFIIQFIDVMGSEQLFLILVGNEGQEILEAGRYTGENGGVYLEKSEFYINEGKDGEYTFSGGSADVVVEGGVDGYTFDIKLADTKGNSFHFTYEGKVNGMDPNGFDVEFDVQKMYSLYGGQNATGAYSYTLILSDKGITDENMTIPGSCYYVLCLYCESECAVEEGYLTLPAGDYILDTSELAGTFSHAKYVPSNHTSLDDALPFEQGVLTITEEGLSIEAKINGERHLITYNGTPRFDMRE